MRSIRFYGQHIKFSPVCVCCLQPVHKEYNIDRTFYYGRNSILLQLPVPLCQHHYQKAATQSPAQIWCERLGLTGAGVFGIGVSWGLMRYWSATEQGSLFFNLLLALIVGGSMVISIWAITKYWIAPLFAFAETKAVLNSVRMTRFDPSRQILGLAIENETIAELTARENQSILVM